MTNPTPKEVIVHIARLARLDLTEVQIERYAGQLADVFEHVSTLQDIDVTDVEPLAHPLIVSNRLDDDEVQPAMSQSAVLVLTPEGEGPFIAVPKTIDADGGDG